MCSSFAWYSKAPVYGMNFDCWDFPCRFRMVEGEEGLFSFDVELGGTWLETASMNRHGLFANFQGNISPRHRNVGPGPGVLPVAELYRGALRSCATAGEVLALIGDRTVAYAPVPPETNMLHNLFADAKGGAFVLESSEGKNSVTRISGTSIVMTNFPVDSLGGHIPENGEDDPSRPGLDRYGTLARSLEALGWPLRARDFLGLLAAVTQAREWETLASMVFDPARARVYVSIRRDFSRVWCADLASGRIDSGPGFTSKASFSLQGEGVSLARLEACR